jgi:hypothetical protein
VVLPLELFLVVPGVSLTRGEFFLQQTLFDLTPEALLACVPLGCLWAVNTACVHPIQDQPLGEGSSILCRLCCVSDLTRTRSQCPLGLSNEDGRPFGAIKGCLPRCGGLERFTGPVRISQDRFAWSECELRTTTRAFKTASLTQSAQG